MRETGVPIATIGRWAREAGLDGSTRAQQTDAAVREKRRGYEVRRVDLANELGDLAATMISRARRNRDARAAKDEVIVAAIAIDKAERLSAVASRIGGTDIEALRASIVRMAAERRQWRGAVTQG